MKYSVEDEQAPQSTFSPGVVKDEETLLRWHFHPEHFRDGKILPSAITTTDLKEKGLSIDRHQYTSKARIENEIEQMQTRSPGQREFALLCRFSCYQVRALQDTEEDRSFVVIDEALKENKAHASVYSAKDRSKGMLRKIRNDLLSILDKHSNIDDLFS